MKKGHNFRELKIWQEAMSIVKEVYQLSANLPNVEKFGLVAQIQRCAVSIPSNIAEGSGRSSEKEFIHFLRIAISSSYELETQLILVQDLYACQVKDLIESINLLQAKIGAFIRKLNSDV